MKKQLFLILMALGLVLAPFGNVAGAQSVKKIVIDAGHGGSDSGASGNGLREKEVTLAIAKKINSNLTANYVVQTRMTRSGDTYPSLKARTDMANSWGANLFLSVHINAGGGTGYEDYVYTKPTSEEIKVQNEIHKEVNKVLADYGKKNRGKKRADFHVLRESKMASILLEILFIDTKSDADLLKQEQFLNDISEAISRGVANALNLPKKNGSGVSTPSSPKPPAKEEIVVSKASGTYIVTTKDGDPLNIRAGNSTSYPIVGSLKRNTKIKVTGITSNNWYQFTFNGKPAYVSGAYLKPAGAAAKPVSNTIKVTKASGTYIVTAGSLNVRSGNTTKHGSLGVLKKNSQVKVTGKTSNNWYRITYKGKTGYVSGAYLKKKPAAAAKSKSTNTIKVTKASGTYKVTATSLNVRSGNGTNFKSIGTLKKNNSIKVTGKTSNGWYRFSYKGKTGYVLGKHLKAQPSIKASAKTVKPKSKSIKVSKASGTYKVTASSLNVRSGNATSYSTIGSLKRGAKVKVTGKTSNGWYRINYKSKAGYVSGTYLAKS